MSPTLPDVTTRPASIPQPSGGVASATLDMGGAETVGRGIAGAGAELQQAGDQIYQAQDHLARVQAEDAMNQLRAKQMELTYDPAKGFTNRLGSQAIGEDFRKGYEQQFNQAADQISQGINNDRARWYFQKRVPIVATEYQGALLNHQAKQAIDYSSAVAKGSVDTELQTIVRDPTNDNVFKTSVTRINGVLDEFGAQRGMDAGSLEKMKEDAVSTAAIHRIEAVASTDPAKGPVQALRMYEQLKNYITPEARHPLYIALKRIALPTEAKTDADNVLAGAGIPGFQAALQTGGEPATNFAAASLNAPTAPGGKIRSGVPRNPIDVRANLANWVSQAEAAAEKRYPGDPIYRDLVVSQVKNYVGTIVAAQEGQLHAAAATLMTRALGAQGGAKPVTMDELLADPASRASWGMLDPQSQRGIIALLDHNAAQARGALTHSDPAVLNNLFGRLMLPDSDPMKIRSQSQLVPYFAHGLGTEGMDWLTKWIDKAKTPEGNAFLKQVIDVKTTAKQMLLRSMVGQIQPDIAEEAAYRFGRDLETRVEAYRQDPKLGDVQALFTPGSKDYVLDPAKVASYMPSARQAVANAASQSPTTWAVGQVYHFRQGDFQFMGGDATSSGSWKQIGKPPAPEGAPADPNAAPPAPGPSPTPQPRPTSAAEPVLEDAARPQRLSEQEDRIRRQERARQAAKAAGAAISAAAGTTVSAVRSAASGAVEAITPPTPMEVSVQAFRAIVEQGRYRTWNEPTIRTALESGMLTQDEEKRAQRMLASIDKAKGAK